MKRWAVAVDKTTQIYTRVVVEAETEDDAIEIVSENLFDIIFNEDDPKAEVCCETKITDDYVYETTEELTPYLIRKEV